jgi:hypothetical protein
LYAMESFEVLRASMKTAGIKAVSAEMNLSASLLYKWCEESGNLDSNKVYNPLDRILNLYEITGDTNPISWLCQQTGGFLVKNPLAKESKNTPVIRATQGLLKEFSEVLEAVSKSLDDDGEIDQEEAEKIRNEWEDLKEATESFVVACEKGIYMDLKIKDK